jgi:2-dehydro-3-deoxygluconokinase
VTFGEAMIRLSPPGFRRLEQARSLELAVGGAELNTAVGLARLGRSVTWVSRLPATPLGRLIANHAREAGADVRYVLWANDARAGLYFVEFGAAPRGSSVLYDRRGSAMAGIEPGMVAWTNALAGARWFHVTGITPALAPSAAEATREAVHAARAAGLTVSIDLNYRSRLWTPAEARRVLDQVLPDADVLITTEEDSERVLGARGTHEEIARQLASRYDLRLVALTIRDNPLVWRNRWTALAYQDGKTYQARSYEVEIVDRLGAGDAFAAGLIHGLLDDDPHKAIEYAAALGALKHTMPGDFAWITREEVEALLGGAGLRIDR